MILDYPSHEILDGVTGEDALVLFERAARTCYLSSMSEEPSQSRAFLRSLIGRGHLSVFEHASCTVRLQTNRAIANELVRHRLASYSQESTRYVNYSGTKTSGHCHFLIPLHLRQQGILPGEWMFLAGQWVRKDPDNGNALTTSVTEDAKPWLSAMRDAEAYYMSLLKQGWKPELARDVLPLATRTTIVMTANYREWRHVFQLRTAKEAHPEIREAMKGLLIDMALLVPVIFEDLEDF